MKRKKHPALERLVLQLRDQRTAKEQFRITLERIGEYLGYELASDLETQEEEITTSLGKTALHYPLKENLSLIVILRAGLPLYNGLQRIFPQAESGFIGAMRDEHTLKSKISYLALPRLAGRKVILVDTMLATGGSVVDCIKILKQQAPQSIKVVSAIASGPGIKRVRAYDRNIKIYAAAIDPELNEKGYILPGLGDAGDRCYGRKI